MKKPKITYQFSVKKIEELDHLSHEELLEYVKNLTNNLVQEKPPKNSNNSSIPPSSEIVPPKPKKNQSLRRKGGKNGGQFGHNGETLKQTEEPDEIIDIPYSITVCKACGFNLEDAPCYTQREATGIGFGSTGDKEEDHPISKLCQSMPQLRTREPR